MLHVPFFSLFHIIYFYFYNLDPCAFICLLHWDDTMKFVVCFGTRQPLCSAHGQGYGRLCPRPQCREGARTHAPALKIKPLIHYTTDTPPYIAINIYFSRLTPFFIKAFRDFIGWMINGKYTFYICIDEEYRYMQLSPLGLWLMHWIASIAPRWYCTFEFGGVLFGRK